jgi:hypothetical protein
MSDTKFEIIDKPAEDLSKLSTSELADRADHHNSLAYSALSAKDGPEHEFRAGLLKILGGAEDHTPYDVDMLTTSVRTACVAALIVDNGGDLWGEHPKHPKSDWRYEVENGDTMLGYWEWAKCKLDEAESDEEEENSDG